MKPTYHPCLLTFTLGSLLLLYGCTGCGQKNAPPTQAEAPLSQQQLTPTAIHNRHTLPNT